MCKTTSNFERTLLHYSFNTQIHTGKYLSKIHYTANFSKMPLEPYPLNLINNFTLSWPRSFAPGYFNNYFWTIWHFQLNVHYKNSITFRIALFCYFTFLSNIESPLAEYTNLTFAEWANNLTLSYCQIISRILVDTSLQQLHSLGDNILQWLHDHVVLRRTFQWSPISE